LPNAPSTLCGFPTVTQGSAGLPMSLRACRTCTCSRSYFQSCPAWFQFSWLTYQARYVRVQVPRRAMHASCESPWHSLAKRTRLGGLLPPQVAFQEHAAHPPRWPGELSSKGSSDTCISDGVSTFLYRAFTAHGAYLARLASPHGVVAVGGVVLDRRNPPGSIVHTGLDITTSAIRAEPVAAGGVVPARHGLYLSSSPATITAQRTDQILPSSDP
jgi:hypothetical protein